ncbi:MAG: hypothetical protein ABIB47_01340 [Candidatus Woesearchaeota archaeon]
MKDDTGRTILFGRNYQVIEGRREYYHISPIEHFSQQFNSLVIRKGISQKEYDDFLVRYYIKVLDSALDKMERSLKRRRFLGVFKTKLCKQMSDERQNIESNRTKLDMANLLELDNKKIDNYKAECDDDINEWIIRAIIAIFSFLLGVYLDSIF